MSDDALLAAPAQAPVRVNVPVRVSPCRYAEGTAQTDETDGASLPTQLHLSPAYGLSPMRLAGDDEVSAWPGVLLHSRSLTWAFDPHSRPLDGLDDVRLLAAKIGLHPITDPFADEIPAGDPSWAFHLPNPVRPASLTGPGMVVDLERRPRITNDWWSMAVTHGGRCRLLIAACVAFPDDPYGAGDVLIEAANGGRVYGATIGVQF